MTAVLRMGLHTRVFVQVFFMSQADVLGSRRDHKLRKAQLEPTLEALSDHCGDVIEPHPLHFSQ